MRESEITQRMGQPSAGQRVVHEVAFGQAVKLGFGFGCGLLLASALAGIVLTVAGVLLTTALGLSLSALVNTAP